MNLLLLLLLPTLSAGADEFFYNTFTGADLTQDGEASVTDGFLRLTNGIGSKGHAFYTFPITLSNVSLASFSTTFVFAIIGAYTDLSGHGTIAPYTLLPNKPSRPLLSISYDLSSVLPNTAIYAGFSSSTGVLASRHYILGWSFKLNGEAAQLNYSALSLKTIQDLAQQVHAQPHSHKTPLLPIVLLPSLTMITILVLALAVKVHMKRRSEARRRSKPEWEIEFGPPSFKYKDLVAATNGFKDKMLLGRGGFGRVYKGVMHLSKQTVAIKRVSPESKQGMKEFIAEIAILGRVRHRNLVQLLGYCGYKNELLLVYDYMPNGSLDCYLHNQDGSNLDWDRRF